MAALTTPPHDPTQSPRRTSSWESLQSKPSEPPPDQRTNEERQRMRFATGKYLGATGYGGNNAAPDQAASELPEASLFMPPVQAAQPMTPPPIRARQHPVARVLALLLCLAGLSRLAHRLDQKTCTADLEEEAQERNFLLRVVQPGLAGLMDGSVSTLAPIFATAFVTHIPFEAFLVGMAAATGAGISMAFAEALSDTGELTGRGAPWLRGGVTGIMTFVGGSLHTLPFLIANLHVALLAAYAVVAVELVVIAAIRHRFFGTSWALSILQVVGGGALVFVAALIFGNA